LSLDVRLLLSGDFHRLKLEHTWYDAAFTLASVEVWDRGLSTEQFW